MQNTIDNLIAAVAAPQHGVITRLQLLALGLGTEAIRYRIQIGRLYRLHPGVYAVGHRPVSPYAHAIAAVLACGAGAALSHGSAATLWGIAKAWDFPLEVTAPSKHHHRQLRVHRSTTLTPRDTTVHFGIRVTTPARTLFDNADRLDDVAVARAVSSLRRAGYLSLADLAELIGRHVPSRATNRLRRQVAHPERAPTRSEFEDAFLLFAERYELPDPLVNTRVAGHEADIFYPAHKLVIELDGYEFHSGRDQFLSDRNRDIDLLVAGIATARLAWEPLQLRPGHDAARLHRILAQRAPST